MGEIITWAIIAFSAFFMLLVYIRAKAPLKGFLFNAAAGIGGIAIINLVGAFSGITVALNAATLCIAFTLGLPGVVTILFLRLLVS